MPAFFCQMCLRRHALPSVSDSSTEFDPSSIPRIFTDAALSPREGVAPKPDDVGAHRRAPSPTPPRPPASPTRDISAPESYSKKDEAGGSNWDRPEHLRVLMRRARSLSVGHPDEVEQTAAGAGGERLVTKGLQMPQGQGVVLMAANADFEV